MAGIWLKNRRQHLGMSQEDLAARLQLSGFDIARSTVSHWEQARYRPPFENPAFVKVMSEILDLDVPKMLYMAGFDIQTTHGELAEQGAYIIDSLPPDKQRLAIRLLETLKD